MSPAEYSVHWVFMLQTDQNNRSLCWKQAVQCENKMWKTFLLVENAKKTLDSFDLNWLQYRSILWLQTRTIDSNSRGHVFILQSNLNPINKPLSSPLALNCPHLFTAKLPPILYSYIYIYIYIHMTYAYI